MSWENSFDIHWIMTRDPLSEESGAGVWGEDSLDPVKTKIAMNKEIPIKKGDEIAVIYSQGEPIFTVKYNKSDRKLKTVLQYIYKIIDTPLVVNSENTDMVYPKVANFFKSEMRLELIQKYEQGDLKPKDLMGSYDFFEGMQRDGKRKFIDCFIGS